MTQPEAVEIDAVTVTLKPGRVWVRDGQRVLIVAHVDGQKPRVRVLGPARRHQWVPVKRRGHGDYCSLCGTPLRFAPDAFCSSDYQQ